MRRDEPFAAIDLQFGALIRRLAGASPAAELLEISAALVSRQRAHGHSCLPLAEEAGRMQVLGERRLRVPRLPAWRETLAGSELVALAEQPACGNTRPLVLDARDRLYLWRYWAAERRIAERLRELTATASGESPADEAAGLWRRLFPQAQTKLDWQAAAAATALSSPLALISGGPGTGKTTTVVRLLALLRAAEPGLRLALAAPTGKAAARLEEAISGQLGSLDRQLPDAGIRELVGQVRASTLHRLLAYSPSTDRFGRHRRRPLTCDVLVVDEASMVDLLMMDAVLDSLPAGARLVLLGDQDQLASVDTGFVFGDLCTAAGLRRHGPGPAQLSPRQVEAYGALGGAAVVGSSPDATVDTTEGETVPLAGCGVELQVSYRFRDRPGIGALARALRAGDAPAALDALERPEHAEVRRLDPPPAPEKAIFALHGAIDRYLECTGPAAALDALDGFRILCATRRGRWGTASLNAAVEAHLSRSGAIESAASNAAGFYGGQPILVEENDYTAQLFNGDLGVCWADGPGPGPLWVFFRGPDGLRRIALAKLPRHTTAWAMTVHKAQGTELDHVLLVLGEEDAAGLVSRELLYTGVTRARREVDVVATPRLLREATRRSGRRRTGLADALGAAAG